MDFADPTQHPKWLPDQISRFATEQFPDQHTDRPIERPTQTHTPTDVLGDSWTPLALTLAILNLIESDALKTKCNGALVATLQVQTTQSCI